MNTTDEKVLSFEDIVKPENLVYEKPRLLNDNTMHYCPGCSHGVVHKLVAEVIDEMGLAEESVALCLPTTTSISTGKKLLTVVLLLLQQLSRDCIPANWFSPIKVTVTSLLLVRLRRSMPPTVVKIS